MNHDVLRRVRTQHLIPAHHDFLVVGNDLLESGRERCLERRGISYPVLLHVLTNPRIGLPLLRVALVAAEVNVGIGKQGSHFADEAGKKLVRAFAGGIDRRAVGWNLAAREFGIALEPRCRVAWHIEFWDNRSEERRVGKEWRGRCGSE